MKLSRFHAEPREGHLKRMLRVLGYMKKYPSMAICMNPKVPDLGTAEKPEFWKEHYPDAKENIPRDAP